MTFTRPLGAVLARRIAEPRRFILAVAGPRQAGKTTLVQQVTEESGLPTHYASADGPTLRGREWLEQQWEAVRLEARDAGSRPSQVHSCPRGSCSSAGTGSRSRNSWAGRSNTGSRHEWSGAGVHTRARRRPTAFMRAASPRIPWRGQAVIFPSIGNESFPAWTTQR